MTATYSEIMRMWPLSIMLLVFLFAAYCPGQIRSPIRPEPISLTWAKLLGARTACRRGRTYKADRFGNINYGYTGGSLGLSYSTLISGSVYAQDPRNGKSKVESGMNDWLDIAKGFIGQTGKADEVNYFNAIYCSR